jgi:hypothetical protein
VITQDHGGTVNYTAFSPKEYIIGSQTRKRLYEKFIGKLCTHISYDPNNPLNNNSSLGKVLEIHTRFIQAPLEERGDLARFSTLDHPCCGYKPVHHESPIEFGVQTENHQYANHQFV